MWQFLATRIRAICVDASVALAAPYAYCSMTANDKASVGPLPCGTTLQARLRHLGEGARPRPSVGGTMPQPRLMRAKIAPREKLHLAEYGRTAGCILFDA